MTGEEIVSTFEEQITSEFPNGLTSDDISMLQVNLGRQCNLSCSHCHLECSPSRTEIMSKDIMEKVVALAAFEDFKLIDITGGAPELHPDFRWLVESLRDSGKPVQVRTNLALIDEKDDENISNFLYDNGVSLVGSLPCYMEENVDAQRGSSHVLNLGIDAEYVSHLDRTNEAHAVECDGYGSRLCPFAGANARSYVHLR